MGDVTRLLRYARGTGASLVGAAVLALVGVGLELARPFPFKVVVDYALIERPIPGWLDSVLSPLPGDVTPGMVIVWSLVAAVAISVGVAVAAVVATKLVLRVAFRMVIGLASDVFEKMQRLSLSFHQRNAVGDLLQRSSSDVFVAQQVVSGVLFPASLSALTLVGMFVVMARIDLPLTLLALLVIPLQGVAFAVFARPMSRQSEAQWRTQGEVMAFMENVLGAIKAIQGFAREPYFARRARQAAEALGATYERSAVTGTAYQQTVAALTGVATAIMLGVGAVHVRNGDVTVGDLFVFITYLGALYGPVREVAQAVGIGVQVSARARRVFAILDSDEVIPDDRPGTSVRLPIGEISFEGVSTGYDRGAGPLLQDVSFRVPAGHVVAIVGMSGAGKTTLISLLSRFADQWTGRICFDGIDIREYSLVSVREQVALVLQDPFLLPMSIADNIAFGDPWATRPAIEAAARTAQVHEFVTRLPRGYDTVIGERGVTLSGGERQRLSIARAVLADAPILVLDEPTSALDARTEELIFGALDEAIAGRTVFIISHRLSTIRRADLIIAIDGGRVAEIGTHEALLAQDGVYADLYRKQYLELR